MKAITLWEPYATLIAIRAKKYETRDWATRYRGDLVIHAARKRGSEITDEIAHLQPEIDRVCEIEGLKWQPYRYGAALCVARLVACHPTESVPLDDRRFGNFAPRRFAWELADIRPFDPPIECKGAQGLWNWQSL